MKIQKRNKANENITNNNKKMKMKKKNDVNLFCKFFYRALFLTDIRHITKLMQEKKNLKAFVKYKICIMVKRKKMRKKKVDQK